MLRQVRCYEVIWWSVRAWGFAFIKALSDIEKSSTIATGGSF